jgi:hypothetical protein
VMLPEGVEKKTVKGRTYFYWNPGRGTPREGKRIRLPNLDISPAAFFKELELYTKRANPVPLAGSVSFLVQRYRDTEDFKRLSESTKASYGIHLNRFEIAWGALSYELPPGAAIALRDSLADTPGMANHMLSVGRTLWNGATQSASSPTRSCRSRTSTLATSVTSLGQHGPLNSSAKPLGLTWSEW